MVESDRSKLRDRERQVESGLEVDRKWTGSDGSELMDREWRIESDGSRVMDLN